MWIRQLFQTIIALNNFLYAEQGNPHLAHSYDNLNFYLRFHFIFHFTPATPAKKVVRHAELHWAYFPAVESKVIHSVKSVQKLQIHYRNSFVLREMPFAISEKFPIKMRKWKCMHQKAWNKVIQPEQKSDYHCRPQQLKCATSSSSDCILRMASKPISVMRSLHLSPPSSSSSEKVFEWVV